MPTLFKSIFFKYSSWVIIGVVIYLLGAIFPNSFANSFLFSIIFLYFVTLPGWLIARIFSIQSEDSIGRFLINFALSLGFYLIISFFSIALSLSLEVLTFVVIILSVLLFGIALFLDIYFQKSVLISKKNFKNPENLYYLLPLAIGIFILFIVYLKGPGLDGDPYLHLSIIRKALEADKLNSRALAFTKVSAINPAYLYPVWHVFLGFFSKIISLDPLIVWSKILFPLTAISLLTWYFLCTKIFTQKFWSILAFSIFSGVTFYAGTGYLFTRLGVPDTLSQFIILPLAVGLSLEFIFSKHKKLKLLVPIGLLGIISLLVHGPHFFYLLFTFIAFGIFWAIVAFKDPDYRKILVKIGQLLSVIILPLILLLIIIEIRFQSVSSILGEFDKVQSPSLRTQFTRFGLLSRYGYILMPLALLFIRQKRVLFIFASLSLVPIIYWTPLGGFLGKYLSYVFVGRLRDNTTLYFLIFSLVLGLTIIILDRIVSRLSQNIRKITAVFLVILTLFLIFLEVRFQTVFLWAYNVLYSKSTSNFVNENLVWFFLLSGLLTIIGFLVWKLNLKRNIILDELEIKNKFLSFMLVILITLFFFTPSLEYLRIYLPNPERVDANNYFSNKFNNDSNALEYVKTNIPLTAVILANKDVASGLSVLSGRYMAYNLGSAYETKLMKIFSGAFTPEQDNTLILDNRYMIDYVYLEKPALENLTYFDSEKELFTKIYDGQSIIYKVIK